MASPRPSARQGALLLGAVLCACGIVALLAVAVAPARAQAGSVALGQIFPGRSVFAGEHRGRRAARTSLGAAEARTSLEEGGSEDAAQDGAAPADDTAEEPATGGAPKGSDATEEAGAGEAGSEEQAAPPTEDSGEAAPAEEEEGAAPAEEEGAAAPAEETGKQALSAEEEGEAAPTEDKVEEEEKGDTAAEEEKQDDSKPSDFLKGMVRRVAREVLPPAARAKLRSSSDNVQAANLQLAEARKLQRGSRKEEHKAMYAARLPQPPPPSRI